MDHTEEQTEELYVQLSRLGQALASSKRLQLLDLMCQAELSVEHLAKDCGLTLPNASRHLAVLRSARLVRSRKDGLHVRYRVVSPRVREMVESMRRIGEEGLVEFDRAVNVRAGEGNRVPRACPKAVAADLRAGSAFTFLDVRCLEEFDAAHVVGARCIPLRDLSSRSGELPSGREVIVLGHGRYWGDAAAAARLLTDKGYRARWIAADVDDWRAAGLSLETSAHEAA